jgi:hypothetical protein
MDRPDAYSVQDHPLQRGLSCALLAAKKVNDTSVWKTAGQIVPEYLSSIPVEKKKT